MPVGHLDLGLFLKRHIIHLPFGKFCIGLVPQAISDIQVDSLLGCNATVPSVRFGAPIYLNELPQGWTSQPLKIDLYAQLGAFTEVETKETTLNHTIPGCYKSSLIYLIAA